MGGFHEIDVNIVVSENGTPNRCNTDGFIQNIHFFQDFRHQTVRRPVSATGTIMRWGVCEPLGAGVNQVFRIND
jgi:hypothetical protein